MALDLPILDSHIHLDPKGDPENAVKRFMSRGGTHLIIIHKPYHHIPVKDIESYTRSFETTIKMCGLANDLGCRSWCLVGPYPGELPHIAKTMGFEKAVQLQQDALNVAFRMVDEGEALGIGEVGRVHFPVEDRYQNACDEILSTVFNRAGNDKFPVVLHTESYHAYPNLMKHLATLIDRSSLSREKVIKHYSGPDLITPEHNLGISLSLQCRKETLKMVLSTDHDHLWETDFIDDPDRPNVVMPPDTVPKKFKWAYDLGLLDEKRWGRMMIDLPKRVLGIETDL